MELFKLFATLDLNSEKYDGKINASEKKGQSFATKVKSSMTSASFAFNQIRDAAASMYSVMSRTVGETIHQFANFDDAMRQVQATMGITAEQNAAEVEKLTAAAKKMGAETRYTAAQAAEALNYLALAGYDADRAISALPTALNLAQAGGLDLGRATDLVTDSMSALGIEVSRLDEFVDQMAKTSQKSNTNVSQLGDAILTVGGTAKNMAGGTVELNAALGILADNGIKGAEGGTALRNILLALSAPTDAAASTLKKLGIETYDAGGNLRGLNEIFADLDGAMEGWTQKQRTDLFSTLFNNRDLKSAEALMANYGDRWNELTGYIEDAEDTASQMAGTMEGGLGGMMRSWESAFEGVKIAIGEMLSPAASGVLGGLTDLARTFTEHLPKGLESAFSAAMGKVREFVPKVATTITKAAPQVVKAGAEIITELVKGMVDSLPEMLPALLEGIGSVAQALVSSAGDMIGWLGKKVAGMFGIIIEDSDEALERSLSKMDKREREAFQKAFDNIDTSIDLNADVNDNATPTIEGAVRRLRKTLLSIDVLSDDDRDKIMQLVGEDVDPILAALQGAGIDTTTGEGAGIAAKIVDAASELNAAMQIAKGTTDGIDAKTLAASIEEGRDAIINALTDAGATGAEAETAADKILAAKQDLTDACTGMDGIVPDDIVEIIAGEKSTLVEALSGMNLTDADYAELIQSLESARSQIGAKVSELTTSIFTALTDGEKDTPEQTEALKAQVAAMTEGLSSQIDTTTEKGKEMADRLTELQNGLNQYIEEMSGQSTDAVKNSYGQLEKLGEEAEALYGEITSLTASAQRETDGLAARMVKAGVTSSPEKVAEAFGNARREFDTQRARASERANQKRAEADRIWGEEDAAADGHTTESARVAARAAAQEKLDAALKEINDAEQEAFEAARAQYLQESNELFKGLTKHTGDESPELVEAMMGAQKDLDFSEALQQLVNQIVEDKQSGKEVQMTPEQQALFMEGLLGTANFSDMSMDEVMRSFLGGDGGLGMLSQLMDVAKQMEEEATKALGDSTGTAQYQTLQSLVEKQLFSDTGIDIESITGKMRIAMGELDIPVIVQSALSESLTTGGEAEPATVPVEFVPEANVDASEVPGKVDEAVQSATAGQTIETKADVKVTTNNVGVEDGEAYADGIGETSGAAASAATTVAAAAAKAISSKTSAARTAGRNFGQGFISGMASKLAAVIAKAKELAQAAIDTVNKTTETASPSRAMRRSGRWFGTGYELGIGDKTKDVAKASKGMARAAMEEIEQAEADISRMSTSLWDDITVKGDIAVREARQSDRAQAIDYDRLMEAMQNTPPAQLIVNGKKLAEATARDNQKAGNQLNRRTSFALGS